MSAPIRSVIGPTRARLVNYISDAKNLLLPNGNPTEKITRALHLKITNAIKVLETKNKEWSELIITADGAEKAQLQQEYSTFTSQQGDANFINVMDEGREMVDSLELLLMEIGTADSSGKSRIRLPQLGLPEFDGRLSNWSQFWSAFEAAIDNDKSIPEVQKMAYLIGCLKGEADKEMKGYSVTGDNYKIAKEHLIKRFGNKDALNSALFSDLRKTHSLSSKTPDVRKLVTEVTRILNQLKEIGEEINNKSTEELIQQKLPDWVLLEVFKQKECIPSFNTEKLIELVDKILRQRETVWELSKANNRFQTDSKIVKINRNENTFSGEEKKVFQSRLPCVFCSMSNHTSNRCLKYETRESRLKRLFELKKCLKCFKDGHISKDCPQKIQCKQCNGPHFVAICLKIDKNSKYNKSSRDSHPNFERKL